MGKKKHRVKKEKTEIYVGKQEDDGNTVLGVEFGEMLKPNHMNVALSIGLVVILEFFILNHLTPKFMGGGLEFTQSRLITALVLFIPLALISYIVISIAIYRKD